MRSLLRNRLVQMLLKSLRPLLFDLGINIDIEVTRQHLAVQIIRIDGAPVGGVRVQRQPLLRRGNAIQLRLGLVPKQAHQLGQGYRFFRGVDNCFDLCFKAHS